MRQVRNWEPSPAMVVALLALVVAMSGTAVAVTSTGGDAKSGSTGESGNDGRDATAAHADGKFAKAAAYSGILSQKQIAFVRASVAEQARVSTDNVGVKVGINAALGILATSYKNGLPKNTVKTKSISKEAITARAIQKQAIEARALAPNAVTTPAIAPQAITAPAIKPDTITGIHFVDNAITAIKLAQNAVTASKLANNAVTSTAIAPQAIDASLLAPNAVTAPKIAPMAVTSTAFSPAVVRTTTIAQTVNQGAEPNHIVVWDDAAFAAGGFSGTGTTGASAPVGGTYEVTAKVNWEPSAMGDRTLVLKQTLADGPGTVPIASSTVPGTAAPDGTPQQVTAQVSLEAGESIFAVANHGVGGLGTGHDILPGGSFSMKLIG